MDEKYNNDTQSVYSECLYSERTHKRKPEILSKGIRLIGELVKHTVQFHLLSNEEFLLTKQARRVNSRSKQRVCVGCAMRSHVNMPQWDYRSQIALWRNAYLHLEWQWSATQTKGSRIKTSSTKCAGPALYIYKIMYCSSIRNIRNTNYKAISRFVQWLQFNGQS